MRTTLLVALTAFVLCAAESTEPQFWSASQGKEMDKSAKSKLNPERHLGTERLNEMAFIAYRDGNAEPELHTKLADLMLVRAGSGIVLIRGKLIEGRSTAPDEVRAKGIEGAKKYPIAAGDTLYIPAGVPHQFTVAPGESFTAMLVKITPKQ